MWGWYRAARRQSQGIKGEKKVRATGKCLLSDASKPALGIQPSVLVLVKHLGPPMWTKSFSPDLVSRVTPSPSLHPTNSFPLPDTWSGFIFILC